MRIINKIKEEILESDLLQRVVNIVDPYVGIYSLKIPLEQQFGKGSVSFYNSVAIMLKPKYTSKTVVITSKDNAETNGEELSAQNGNLLIGFLD